MIKKILKIAGVALLLATGTSCSTAKTNQLPSLKSGNSMLGNLIEGVFSTSKLDIEDLAGEWTSNGSAVKFKSENFLKQAGGQAAAATIETKLDPYYKQLGLTGALMTIQTDGSFKMKIKSINMSGQIKKLDNGNFNFNFQILGGMSLGNIETYISKTSGQMDVMFDADKLVKLIQFAGKLTGMKTIQSITDLLGSYDGICVGFKMEKTGKVEGEKTTVGGVLNDLFNGGKKQDTQTEQKTEQQNQQNSGSLLDILKKKK
ncbi:MAG: DUF4923 family protein [Muribaculaceae bacterium]|nr:DUF4923 family protein [Muribaculaceae bacterium]